MAITFYLLKCAGDNMDNHNETYVLYRICKLFSTIKELIILLNSQKCNNTEKWYISDIKHTP